MYCQKGAKPMYVVWVWHIRFSGKKTSCKKYWSNCDDRTFRFFVNDAVESDDKEESE